MTTLVIILAEVCVCGTFFLEGEQCQIYNETEGKQAHQRATRLKPDMVVVDLEITGLVHSWMAMQLETTGTWTRSLLS